MKMARVRVFGTLFDPPVVQRLKDGGLCVSALVKAKDGNHTRFWHIAALSGTVQAALLHLSEGNQVAVQGTLKAEIRETNGEIALSFGVIAEHVLGLHPLVENRMKQKKRLNETRSGESSSERSRFPATAE
jgi:single-stranded DNA-binding protein